LNDNGCEFKVRGLWSGEEERERQKEEHADRERKKDRRNKTMASIYGALTGAITGGIVAHSVTYDTVKIAVKPDRKAFKKQAIFMKRFHWLSSLNFPYSITKSVIRHIAIAEIREKRIAIINSTCIIIIFSS
jgi:hypothetical protein